MKRTPRNQQLSQTQENEYMKLWEQIKRDIKELDEIPRSKIRERRNKAKTISDKMLSDENVGFSSFLENNKTVQKDFFVVTKSIYQHMNAKLEPIEQGAKNYFNNMFRKMGREITNFKFTSKKEGIQLGRIMEINYSFHNENEEQQKHTIKYFIKTHQNGSISGSRSGSTKQVDPKELFVYKTLEYMGYGPKAHFFLNPLSLGGFYIATEDLNYAQTVGKENAYIPFQKIKNEYNSSLSSETHANARKGMIKLDILSRIFSLSDTTTNPGNFGVIKSSDGKKRWKLLDFRIRENNPDHYENQNIFTGFKNGNGVFNYDYAKFLKYIFKNKTYQPKRMKISGEFLDQMLVAKSVTFMQTQESAMSLKIASSKALNEVKDYISNNAKKLHIHAESANNDLEAFCIGVVKNASLLRTKVQELLSEQKNTNLSDIIPPNSSP